jgi:hypothetical protein
MYLAFGDADSRAGEPFKLCGGILYACARWP